MNENELAGALRGVRGSCPPTADLVAFVEGADMGARAASIETHLNGCGVCANAARLLREVESVAVPEPEVNWDRGKTRFKVVLNGRGPATRRRLVLWAAAVVAAVAAYPLYRLMSGVSAPPVLAPPVLVLDPPTRSAQQAVHSVSLGDNDRFLAILFFVPERGSDSNGFDCVVEDRSGRAVFSASGLRSFDGLGNILLLIDARRLSPRTSYALRVRRAGAADGQGWTYEFTIR